MLKKVLSLCLVGILSQAIHAKTTEVYMGLNPTTPYDLKPNDTLVLTNFFTYPLKAICTITCENNDTNTIDFKILKKTGVLNGLPLNTGDAMSLEVHTKDELHITASTGAKVELKNVGKSSIHADCAFS